MNLTLEDELHKLFGAHKDGSDAKMFLEHFGRYCHSIDDLVDGDIKCSPENLGALVIMALNIYSSRFYNVYSNLLYPVIRLIHHTYFDSVGMENAPILWQKEAADTLKSVGQEMTLMIIEILGGYEERRRLGILVRETSYNKQHEIILTN